MKRNFTEKSLTTVGVSAAFGKVKGEEQSVNGEE